MQQELRCLQEEIQDRAARELVSRQGGLTAARYSPQAFSTPSNSRVALGPSWAGTEEGAQFFRDNFPSPPGSGSLPGSGHAPGFADSFVGETSMSAYEFQAPFMPFYFLDTANSRVQPPDTTNSRSETGKSAATNPIIPASDLHTPPCRS